MRTPRGIDRALFQKLVAGDWIERVEGLLITGPTSIKSLIARALGRKACRDGKSVLYHRAPRLFEALALARGDGRYGQRVQLLILDDWGLSILTEAEQRDLLKILEDRHQRASTIVTSQLPVEQRHEINGSPTLADAILDRLIHNARRLPMARESMRKLPAKKRLLDDAPKT
jgi:DNA replication protein DnaC